MLATPVTVPLERIMGQARGKGGLLGKLLVRPPLAEVKLEYVRFYAVRLPYTVAAWKFPCRRRAVHGELAVVVNALYGHCAMNAVRHGQVAPTLVEGEHFQNGRYEMDSAEAERRATAFARRVIVRLCRSLPAFGDAASETFFRPYYMAYYGDPESRTAKYLPFEADGLTFKR